MLTICPPHKAPKGYLGREQAAGTGIDGPNVSKVTLVIHFSAFNSLTTGGHLGELSQQGARQLEHRKERPGDEIRHVRTPELQHWVINFADQH
jgi:hypothetical protein